MRLVFALPIRPMAWVLALLPCVVIAQDGGQGPRKEGWSFQAGAVFLSAPAAPGAGQVRNRALPIFGAEYDHRYYFGSSRATPGGAGLGMHMAAKGPFEWDLGLGWAEGRKEKRAEVLAGMGDQTGSLWLGTAFSYRFGPLKAGLSAAHGLSSATGNRMGLHLETRYFLARRWIAGASASVSLADAKNMAYDFGVTPEQASLRQALIAGGDRRLRAGEGALAYRPKGGLREAETGGTVIYLLNPNWSLIAMVKASRLLGEAAGSPLVRKRDALSGGMGVSVAF